MDESDAPAHEALGDPFDPPDPRRTRYTLAFVDEFAPLYAMFTL